MPFDRLRDAYAAPPPSDVPLTGYLGVLRHDDGRAYSTELNVGISDPRLNGGRSTNIPLLVPGQRDIEGLLAGGRLTDDQVRAAIDFALARQRRAGATYPSFDTPDDSERGALARHDALERAISQRLELGPDGMPIATPTIFDRKGHDLRGRR